MSARRRGRGEGSSGAWTAERLASPAFHLVLSTVLLCAIGLVMIFSASSIEGYIDASGSSYSLGGLTGSLSAVFHQFLIMLIGAAACAGIARLVPSAHWVSDSWPWWYLALLALLVLVLAVGVEANGAKRWLNLGVTTFQPSELMKIVLVMVMARYMARWQEGQISSLACGVQLVLLMLVPIVLVYAQHDLGTLLITCAALYGVAWLGGMRKGVLLVVAVGAVVAVLLVVFLVGYRSSRFSAWLDPFGEYYGNGWQLAHGLYAFSSGGFFGTGIGMGLQKYEYLPEAENDFVFAVIGEETGFVGCMVVIGLFVLFGVAGLRISYAARERSLAESLLAGGLVVAIEAQALLNIGGTTGVLPLSGRPLPFISAGGTSVLVSLVMVAILYTIARANDRYRVERAQETGRRVRQRNLTVIDGGTEDREGRP